VDARRLRQIFIFHQSGDFKARLVSHAVHGPQRSVRQAPLSVLTTMQPRRHRKGRFEPITADAELNALLGEFNAEKKLPVGRDITTFCVRAPKVKPASEFSEIRGV
jgi:hypothetical protein